MSWSETPMDLFHEITKRLDVVDIIRSECVCAWWRSVSSYREYSRRSRIPWLMLSPKDDDKIKFRYFYNLMEHKVYRISLPEIAGHHCVGSSHGYLLSIDRDSNLVATNPLAGGSRLLLPPTSTHLDMAALISDFFPFFGKVIFRDSCSGLITEFEINGNGILYIADPEYFRKRCYRKAILSPDADIVVVIQGSMHSLAFARIGDQSWTALKVPTIQLKLDDIIFHKGRLYALDFTGTIAIFDLDHPSDPSFMSPTGPLASENGALSTRYLVESPCGENLFLVCRDFNFHVGEVVGTYHFKVYVLDKATYTWNRMKTLGDVSMFLGVNYSMFLCTREFPSIKRNCIYFTSDDINRPHSASDVGVFNLDDKTVGLLYHDSNLHGLNWQPPIWFMPTLL